MFAPLYSIRRVKCKSTGCGRVNACFSNNNNSVDFQVKKILITQKERFYNAVFVEHFWITSETCVCVCDVRTDLTSASLALSRTPRAYENCQSHSLSVFRGTHRRGKARWFPLHHRPCCPKRINPPEYCVTIRDVSTALHIELFTEKALNGNYGFTTFDIIFNSTVPWLLKLHHLSCLPARGGNLPPTSLLSTSHL
jgi:hypothetical protein